MSQRLIGIVPCAGRSRRMGADKATLDAGGQTFLERVVSALAPACTEVRVVLERERSDLAQIATAAGATVVWNPDPTDGPISSIRAALFAPDSTSSVSSTFDGFVLLPVDHPAVRAETVQRIVDEWDGSSIAVATHQKQTGHPALFPSAAFDELLDPALEGGARTVLHRDPARIQRVPVEHPSVLGDLDEPAAWSEAIAGADLPPPDPIGLSEIASRTLESLEAGREALVFARLDELPASRLLLLASADRNSMRSLGTLGSLQLDAAARARGLPLLAGRIAEGDIEIDGVRLYAEVHRPRPELVVVGAGHISLPLADVGRVLGFAVQVIDDRPEFAVSERFPDDVAVHHVDFRDAFADIRIGPLTHVVLVTRGHKYDYECLRQLMLGSTMPRYIGLIGSRRRVRATFVQLLEEGLDRERVAQVRAPVGLDLGAETPGEIAVAVGAEIVREWRGGTGDPLREKERILDRFFKTDTPDGDLSSVEVSE